MKYYLLSLWLITGLFSDSFVYLEDEELYELSFPCQDSGAFPDYVSEDFPETAGDDLLNLEEGAQDFILETKQIVIPECPHAFNPSIVRWRGALLMSFRVYNPTTRVPNYIGLSFLDEKFNPIGSAFLLHTRTTNPFRPFKRQDPRLITVGGRLFIVYNDLLDDETSRRMCIAEVHFDGTRFFSDPPQLLCRFKGERKDRWEKNWTPFEHDKNLMLAYSLVPHLILHPREETCEEVAITQSPINWKWGTLRGGTPALREGDRYLAFFHSSIPMSSKHSEGKVVPHYFMGAYTFEAQPPFAVTAVSPSPLIGKEFYEGTKHKTWRPLHVVFPGGFVFDNQHVWIAYGRQDHEIWLAKLNKEKLLNSLVPTQ